MDHFEMECSSKSLPGTVFLTATVGGQVGKTCNQGENSPSGPLIVTQNGWLGFASKSAQNPTLGPWFNSIMSVL